MSMKDVVGPASARGKSKKPAKAPPEGLRPAAENGHARAGSRTTMMNAVRPDVIVSDIAMPGGDGYGLIRAVRKLGHDRGGRTPAIALTAHARDQAGSSFSDGGGPAG